jgi:hypothetical protein
VFSEAMKKTMNVKTNLPYRQKNEATKNLHDIGNKKAISRKLLSANISYTMNDKK